jgi:hypothetical protein
MHGMGVRASHPTGNPAFRAEVTRHLYAGDYASLLSDIPFTLLVFIALWPASHSPLLFVWLASQYHGVCWQNCSPAFGKTTRGDPEEVVIGLAG